MDQKVLNHFKLKDPIIYEVIKKLGKFESLHKTRGIDYFEDLVGAIVSQQLSTKAADTIFKRLKALVKNKSITPKAVLSLKDDQIRAAGMSYSKIKYIKDLAQKSQSGEVKLQNLKNLPDKEVIGELVKIKGIGPWTAEMFLIFSLKREDVFSHGDLGLQNAIKKIYKIEKYTEKKAEKIVSRWSPYKSYASLVLWRSLDNKPKLKN